MNNSQAIHGCIESVSDNLYVDFNYKTFPRVAVLPEGTHLFIKGWIVDATRKCAFELGNVYVCIDEHEYKAARMRRPDIESALGGKNGEYLWCGFSLSMELPYNEDGRKHTITVIAVDPCGNRHRLNDSVELMIRNKNHVSFSGVEKILREYVLHSEDCILHHPFVSSVGLMEGIKAYLKTGAESAEQLKATCKEIFPQKAKLSLFEFASGYGCVTRHLDKKYFDTTSCDIHQQAMAFIMNNFDTKISPSTSEPDDFTGKGGRDSSFDIVFALSFFSHIPDRTFGRWIRALYGCVKSGGALLFTTHGKISNETLIRFSVNEDGFAYEESSEQSDLSTENYGHAVTYSPYVRKQIREYTSCTSIECRESVWWGHQDLYILRKPE